jgi:hypothetical protein
MIWGLVMRSILLVGSLLLVFMVTSISAQEERELPSLEVITAENANRLELLGYLGHGGVDDVIWSPDGAIMALVNRQGIYLYNTDNIHNSPQFLMSTGGFITQVAFSLGRGAATALDWEDDRS